MSATLPTYAALLELVRRQSDAAARGDIYAAVALMPDRAHLLANAVPATQADHDTIREILDLDRELATAIRHRMIELRNQAAGLQQGRTALAGYRPALGERRPRRLDARG